MNPLAGRLLALAAVAHLASIAAKAPMPAPTAAPKRRSGGTMTQQAQGHRGKGQAFHGARAPIQGGVQALRNASGTLPHQQPGASRR